MSSKIFHSFLTRNGTNFISLFVFFFFFKEINQRMKKTRYENYDSNFFSSAPFSIIIPNYSTLERPRT